MRLIQTHTHTNPFSREKITELNSEQIQILQLSVRDFNTTVTYRGSPQTDWLVGQA